MKNSNKTSAETMGKSFSQRTKLGTGSQDIITSHRSPGACHPKMKGLRARQFSQLPKADVGGTPQSSTYHIQKEDLLKLNNLPFPFYSLFSEDLTLLSFPLNKN